MTSALSASRRAAVIGAGNVGATFSYSLLLIGPVNKIVLIDANPTKAEGEAMDLYHFVEKKHPEGDYGNLRPEY